MTSSQTRPKCSPDRRPALRVVLALAAVPLGLAVLAGCSNDDAPNGQSPTGGQSSAGPVAPDPALAAIATAEAAVPGGRAVAYDRGDGGEHSEVEVVADDVSYEITLSGDGTQVAGTERGEPLEADERAEVAAASVPLADAIAVAADEVPGGVVAEAELQTAAAQVVWTVDVTANGGSREVRIDAATGSLLG